MIPSGVRAASVKTGTTEGTLLQAWPGHSTALSSLWMASKTRARMTGRPPSQQFSQSNDTAMTP